MQGRPTQAVPRRKWLLDSGASFDLIGEGNLNWQERLEIMEVGHEQELDTAAGLIKTSRQIKLKLEGTGLFATCWVLDNNCPPIISMGKMCMEEGFSFLWMRNKHAILLSSTGQLIYCVVDTRVPYACPAVRC